MSRINGPIPFRQFKQRVRRHRTTDVLSAIGEVSAEMVRADFQRDGQRTDRGVVQHFSLAAVARAAVVYGNQHRSKRVTRAEVWEMCEYFSQVEDPALKQPSGSDRMRWMLSRIIYEQASFQFSVMENVGRTVALFLDHADGCDGALSADDWRDLLGVSLEEFMRIGFAMHVAALSNQGRISRETLRAAHVAPIFTPLPSEQALGVVDSLYAATVAELSSNGRADEVSGLEKWSLNPLVVKPIVAHRGDYIIPIPRFVIDRFTPTGLYFIALDSYGQQFTDALGCMFERYVGAQLEQLDTWTVHPEIAYGTHGEKSVDFMVVTSGSVLLVEVKAARPIAAARLGQPSSDDDILKKVGRAIEQINNTARLLSIEPALAHINPHMLPIRGLVVTLEPFHLVNTFLYDDVLPTANVPTAIVPAHELEGFVAAVLHEPDPDPYLVAAYHPADGVAPKSLASAVSGLKPLPNPILAEAWDRFMKPIKDLGLFADADLESG